MISEFDLLIEVTQSLECAGIDYMLTGSMALNYYAQPRMTRDIDVVVALVREQIEVLEDIFGKDYYFSSEAAEQAVRDQSLFNIIHNESLMKVDIIIRKQDDYRQVEFERRHRVEIGGAKVWIVSKEDLILSKLEWARASSSERQLADVENLLATGSDKQYLESWSQRLNLTDMLTRVTR